MLFARVEEVRIGEGPGAMVRVRVGAEVLLARITRRSVGALDLAPGKPVLKAVSVAQENVGRG